MGQIATPSRLELTRYPILNSLCWFRHDAEIPAEEAYSIYVENWSAVDQMAMSDDERECVIAN